MSAAFVDAALQCIVPDLLLLGRTANDHEARETPLELAVVSRHKQEILESATGRDLKAVGVFDDLDRAPLHGNDGTQKVLGVAVLGLGWAVVADCAITTATHQPPDFFDIHRRQPLPST